MTKNAKKRKVDVGASLKRRVSAAICLLLISTVMLVTSTYAWYTISTAPEAKGIGTSVTGNGSLEVALMPATGLVTDITSGRGTSGYYGGGNQPITTANVTWGNLVSLIDPSYGLDKVTLNPIAGNFTSDGGFVFSAPQFGPDGRITTATTGSADVKQYNPETGAFSGEGYGVRGIVESAEAETAVGYVIDLALRINTTKDSETAAKLLLSQEGKQRIYSDTEAEATAGEGSYVELIGDMGSISDGLKIAFVQNYGNPGADMTLLAYARLGVADADGRCRLSLYDASGAAITGNVLVPEMTKNAIYQISVIVWIEGADATNADFAANGGGQIKLNLQFATDVVLTPMTDVDVRDNPLTSKGKGVIGDALTALLSKYTAIKAAIPEAVRPQAVTDFINKYDEITAKYNATDENEYDEITLEEGMAVRAELDASYAAAEAAAAALLNP